MRVNDLCFTGQSATSFTSDLADVSAFDAVQVSVACTEQCVLTLHWSADAALFYQHGDTIDVQANLFTTLSRPVRARWLRVNLTGSGTADVQTFALNGPSAVVSNPQPSRRQWHIKGSGGVSATTWDFLGKGDWFLANNIATAQTMQIASNNAADTSAGTGARQVRVYGLGADWGPQEEVVSMNGVTPVTLSNQWTRVNLMVATTVGSNGNPVGTIDVFQSGASSNVAGRIDSHGGVVEHQRAHFTVPKGQRGVIKQVNLDPSGGNLGWRLLKRQTNPLSGWQTLLVGQNDTNVRDRVDIELEGGEEVRMMVYASVATDIYTTLAVDTFDDN